METEQTLGRNILKSGASSLSNVLLLVLVIIGARVLGDQAFGQFSFALAVASVFETLMDLGLNTITIRNVARDHQSAEKYLPNILSWKLILSLSATIIMVGFVNVVSSDQQAIHASYIMGFAIVLRSYKSTCISFFQSHERFNLVLLTSYTERILVLGFGLTALLLTRSLIVFAVSFALARIPDLIFSLWLVNKNIARLGARLDTGFMLNLQKAAIPFGAYIAATVVYSYIGTIVLAAIRPAQEVGWYAAGFRVYEGLTMFPYLIGLALLPRLSRLFVMDRERHSRVTFGILRYLILFTIPLVLFIGILAPNIVSLIYGDGYSRTVHILRVLLAAVPLMFLNLTLYTVLMSADREKIVLRIVLTGLFTMTAANVFLVWRVGVNGAAYAVLSSEMIVQLLLAAYINTQIFRMPLTSLMWRPMTSAALAGILIITLGLPSASIRAIVFIAAYTMSLFVLKTFNKKDLSLLKELLPSRP